MAGRAVAGGRMFSNAREPPGRDPDLDRGSGQAVNLNRANILPGGRDFKGTKRRAGERTHDVAGATALSGVNFRSAVRVLDHAQADQRRQSLADPRAAEHRTGLAGQSQRRVLRAACGSTATATTPGPTGRRPTCWPPSRCSTPRWHGTETIEVTERLAAPPNPYPLPRWNALAAHWRRRGPRTPDPSARPAPAPLRPAWTPGRHPGAGRLAAACRPDAGQLRRTCVGGLAPPEPPAGDPGKERDWAAATG
jgi:hypothetical protein